MILPTLRGYEAVLASRHLEIGCRRCGCQRVLYRRTSNPRNQVKIPAICLKCGSLVVVQVITVDPQPARQASQVAVRVVPAPRTAGRRPAA